MSFEVDEEIKFDLVPKMLKNAKGAGIQYSDIDGIRVTTDDGWWLIRPSNTQNALVARAESNSTEGLKRLSDMAVGMLSAVYDLQGQNPFEE